jgi:glycosyltransferase involved in cell wall biosynthesis
LRLYQAAHVFFFPSLKEGFGMPILEAMACGTPVLTSTAPACAEAAADAALLADPLDTRELASALRRLFDDDGLRCSLAAKGRQRAADFTWQRAARLTLAAYERVLHKA